MGEGAAGLVLVNRLVLPDIDLLQMKLTDTLELSGSSELRLPQLWTTILAGRTKASLAVSTGVQTVEDLVKCLLAGAVMTTSGLLRRGTGLTSTLTTGLRQWMQKREIVCLTDMRGLMSWQPSRDRSAYTHASYGLARWDSCHYATRGEMSCRMERPACE